MHHAEHTLTVTRSTSSRTTRFRRSSAPVSCQHCSEDSFSGELTGCTSCRSCSYWNLHALFIWRFLFSRSVAAAREYCQMFSEPVICSQSAAQLLERITTYSPYQACSSPCLALLRVASIHVTASAVSCCRCVKGRCFFTAQYSSLGKLPAHAKLPRIHLSPKPQ